MKPILAPCTSGIFLCLLLLCSCTTDPSLHSRLPAAVAMNPDAGRGEALLVTLYSESGEELPFMLDTGAGGTLIDKSWEPRLGKCLGTAVSYHWGEKETNNTYAMPRLYLGNAPLPAGGRIVAYDFKNPSFAAGHPIMGVLGMDVLKHYCLQLDFAAGKILFLDEAQADKQEWGKALPLVGLHSNDPRPAVAGNLAGVKGSGSLIDTGCNYDSWLTRQLFQQWTNEIIVPQDGGARFPIATLGGETYADFLHLHGLDTDLPADGSARISANGIGLHFLSRHLVTFDFPKRTMYLKRTSVGPLLPEGSTAALALLRDLKEKGQAPGWAKDDNAAAYLEAFSFPDPQSLIITLLKNGDSSIYRYTVAWTSEDSQWKLQKAWRSDIKGNMIEEYPVH